MPKKQKYSIQLGDGTTREVEGEIVNGIWGIDKREIASGEQTLKDGSKKTLSSFSYVITHLPSGCALPLCKFRTLKSAKLLLSEPEFFGKFFGNGEINIDEISKAIWRFWEQRGWKD